MDCVAEEKRRKETGEIMDTNQIIGQTIGLIILVCLMYLIRKFVNNYHEKKEKKR